MSRTPFSHAAATTLLAAFVSICVPVVAAGQCNPAPAPSLTICSPAAGATVTSPVHVRALAASKSPVSKFLVYVGSQLAYQALNTTSIDTNLAIQPGPHNLTLQFYNGAWTKRVITISVAGSTGGGPAPAPSGSIPAVEPVIVVALENHAYGSVVGSAAMPYLNSLMKSYTLAGNFFAFAPGSVPDYFLLTTGNTVSCCTSYAGPYTGNNLARVLIKGGKTWKAYVQGIPNVGYVGTAHYPYVKYHNPFAYFSDVLNSTEQRERIVPLAQLAADTASGQLPNFSLIVPDNQHNAHDCPGGVSNCMDADKLRAADAFLQSHLPALMTTPEFQETGLLIIWFDEGNNATNKTAVTFVGPAVKKGYVSHQLYKDPNLLRTIIEGLGLNSFPGASATASPMNDLFLP